MAEDTRLEELPKTFRGRQLAEVQEAVREGGEGLSYQYHAPNANGNYWIATPID